MDFWGKKINVSEEAARQQVAIISSFPPKKRLKIALDFANMGVERTRQWIKENNPHFSVLEINLEWVRLMYFEKGEMSTSQWEFYQKAMTKKIRKDWAERFRKMMKENNLTYQEIAALGNFKNGKVVEATISRGLPSFAKLSVILHEKRGVKEVV